MNTNHPEPDELVNIVILANEPETWEEGVAKLKAAAERLEVMLTERKIRVSTNHRERKRSKYDSYKNYRKMVWPDGDTSWVHKDEVAANKKYGGRIVKRKKVKR